MMHYHSLLLPLPGVEEKEQNLASSTLCVLWEVQEQLKTHSTEDPQNDGLHCDYGVLEVRVYGDEHLEEKKREKEERKKQKLSQKSEVQQSTRPDQPCL